MIAKLENISLSINRQKILSDINLELIAGKITTLIGPNGGGKTSIARILLEILKPTSGKIIKNSNLKIGYMPQKITIDKTIPLNAKDFIELSTHKIKFDQALYNLAARLNIDKILSQQIHNLSGGQMQKILFLRALVNNPDLLVLDEPTQYMDVAAIQDFYQIIDELRKASNCSILLISHDLYTVMQKTDIVFCVNHHICCHGSPSDVNQHPQYLALFGNKSALTIYQHHHDHKH
ncbi:MAG: metal ABC transporter ATP-binding protein [Rickettsiales bacterium]|nr:metal ABC transporter ATP-binding protein [Rickettsiales bacterium]